MEKGERGVPGADEFERVSEDDLTGAGRALQLHVRATFDEIHREIKVSVDHRHQQRHCIYLAQFFATCRHL